MISRSTLRDGGLVLLALLTAVTAVYVLLRPAGPDQVASLSSSPAPSRPSSPAATPPAATEPVRALFFGSETLSGDPSAAQLAAERLGWEAVLDTVPGSGYLASPRLVERVPPVVRAQDADVVVLTSTSDPEDASDLPLLRAHAEYVVKSVRDARPAAAVVVVAPVGLPGEAARAQRAVLLRVAARFGAVFVDPASSRYLEGVDGVTADGSLTAAGAARFAERLAADLSEVLPPTLLPKASSKP